MKSSEFEQVAAQLAGRVGAPHEPGVGAPWAGGVQRPGVAGATMQFPGGPGVIVPESTVYKGNSYFSLARLAAADNLVPPNSTESFERKPQRPFIPLQFIAVSYEDDLLIQQISINNTNYMAHDQKSGLPVSLLSEVSQAMGILWKKISVSSGVVSSVHNPTGAAIPFLAGFAGIQLDEEV